jgi:hypothetical protein
MRRVLLLLVLSACGYRFTAPGGALPDGIRAVRAPVFDNLTAEPGAEILFTQAFREQLTRAGTLGGDESEAVVEGALNAVNGAVVLAGIDRTSGLGKLPTYRLSASVRLRLQKAGRVLAETTVSGSEDYLSGADVLLTEANRSAALRRLAEGMMREGYERLASR